ncbi:unnamed protein product [Urochloa decumbens]|uniref:NB-ARC domain-containing protein n=1 Tax=Urochloa decumbens TaxID=240449 RepID=A0ABC9AJM6_9POAL
MNFVSLWSQSDNQNDLKLKVVSILGVEGVGKSMLSQKLWHELGGQFECQAFVRTAKKPDIRMILISILSQIYPQQPSEACQVPDLIRDIKKHLKDKRYFIVIDDLWAVSVWDTLSRSFPEGNRCSRIMTTTTIEDVALACCSYDPDHIFRMRPLSAEHSNQLFIKRAFGTGEGCPQEFHDVSDDITRKCRDLPLAIICMASLVASQWGTIEQWRHVQNLLSHYVRSNSSSEVLKQVLKLYYNSLPRSLKTCLLYLTVYPENYPIVKDDLVKQWIAEDFIRGTEEKDILQVASSYFDELLWFGLLQQMAVNSKKKGLSYVVHPAVFDFITCKSMEDNFVTTIDYSQSIVALTDKIRRLSLHFSSATYATLPASIGISQVRSLTYLGLLNCIPSLVEFRLVRIMILHLRSDDGDTRLSLSEIDKLLLLRYLQVRCNVKVELPDQMQCLKHFETLEINAIVAAIPSDIAHVPKLSDVHIGGKKNHKHLTLGPVASGNAISMDDSSIASTPSIQIFELLPPICIFSRIPEWIQQLSKLRILEVVVGEMRGNDIDVLAELPVLTALSLYVQTTTAENIVFRCGAFPSLEYLKITCGVLLLDFQEEAMLNLRKFKIGLNAHVGEEYGKILGSIHHLLNLQEIAVSIVADTGTEESYSIDVESAFLDQISRHPSRPSFKVKMVCGVKPSNGEDKVLRKQMGKSLIEQHGILGKMPAQDTIEHADLRLMSRNERKRRLRRWMAN